MSCPSIAGNSACFHCRFWLTGDGDSGECHGSPPNASGFPATKYFDWCGAFKEDDETTRTIKDSHINAHLARNNRLLAEARFACLKQRIALGI